MTIIIQPIEWRVSIKADVSETLHKALSSAVGDIFGGLIFSDQTYALLITPVDPQTEATIRAILSGYELRIGGVAMKQAVLDDMSKRYDAQTMASLAANDAMTAVTDIILASDDEKVASRSPDVVKLMTADAEMRARLTVGDIRLVLLDELRAQLGDVIVDLALRDEIAYVSVRSQIDPAVIAKVHKIAEGS